MQRLRLPSSFWSPRSPWLPYPLRGCRSFLAQPRRQPIASAWVFVSTGLTLTPVFTSAGRREGLPSSRECPCPFALLFDPGQTSLPDHYSSSVLFPVDERRKLRQFRLFRGSITQLLDLLPTLHAALSGDDARLAFGGGQPYRSGLATRRHSMKGFKEHVLIPLSRA